MSSTAQRRIIILRHGETDHNAAGIWQGQLDTELSDRGLAQAKACGPAVMALGPSRIVSSDLRRAAVTAQAVARAGGIPLSLDPRFREIHAGQWQGMDNTEVSARFPEERAAVIITDLSVTGARVLTEAGHAIGSFGNCHWAELEQGNHGWRLVTWNVSAGLVETVEGSPPP